MWVFIYIYIYGIYIEVKLFEEKMGSNDRERVKKEGKPEGWVWEKNNDTAIIRYNETYVSYTILVTILDAMTKYMTKSKLRNKRFILAYIFRGYGQRKSR